MLCRCFGGYDYSGSETLDTELDLTSLHKFRNKGRSAGNATTISPVANSHEATATEQLLVTRYMSI
jgi:hypothetical protein